MARCQQGDLSDGCTDMRSRNLASLSTGLSSSCLVLKPPPELAVYDGGSALTLLSCLRMVSVRIPSRGFSLLRYTLFAPTWLLMPALVLQAFTVAAEGSGISNAPCEFVTRLGVSTETIAHMVL